MLFKDSSKGLSVLKLWVYFDMILKTSISCLMFWAGNSNFKYQQFIWWELPLQTKSYHESNFCKIWKLISYRESDFYKNVCRINIRKFLVTLIQDGVVATKYHIATTTQIGETTYHHFSTIDFIFHSRFLGQFGGWTISVNWLQHLVVSSSPLQFDEF